MYLYRKPISEKLIGGAKALISTIIFAMLLMGAVLFSLNAGENTLEQQRQATEDAIRRANGITGDYATGNMIVVPKK